MSREDDRANDVLRDPFWRKIYDLYHLGEEEVRQIRSQSASQHTLKHFEECEMCKARVQGTDLGFKTDFN